MLGDISDEETNELIVSISNIVIKNLLSRGMVETKLFPVTHYIHVACYILYDQSYQYNILKKITSKISPEDIARRSKSLGLTMNQLAFFSLPMLYLHGRAQVIYDNISKKKAGEPNIIVEPETKKKETKFVLDFWKRLTPNYLNNGELTAKDKKIQFLSDGYINNLKDQMIPIGDNKDLINKLKKTMAHLTIYSFLLQGECRLAIYEHGPYYFEGNPEPLIFKEFLELKAGDDMYGIKMSERISNIITKPTPVPNVIFGMTLKDMNKLEFNDWGTLFADPAEFSSNITSIGIWTKERKHPKDLRYPDNMGDLKSISFDILDDLIKYASNATKEFYFNLSKWSAIRKLMYGANIYVNKLLSVLSLYAGIGSDFDWTWADNYDLDKPFKTDLVDKEKIKFYIEKLGRKPIKSGLSGEGQMKIFAEGLQKYEGIHPFLSRMLRRRKMQKIDPFYYYLQD